VCRLPAGEGGACHFSERPFSEFDYDQTEMASQSIVGQQYFMLCKHFPSKLLRYERKGEIIYGIKKMRLFSFKVLLKEGEFARKYNGWVSTKLVLQGRYL